MFNLCANKIEKTQKIIIVNNKIDLIFDFIIIIKNGLTFEERNNETI